MASVYEYWNCRQDLLLGWCAFTVAASAVASAVTSATVSAAAIATTTVSTTTAAAFAATTTAGWGLKQGLAAQLRDLCIVLLSSTDPLQVVVAQGHEVTYHSGRWDGPKPCEPIVCASPCASSAWCSATPLQIQNPQMSAHCYQ